MDRIDLAQDSDKRRALINTVINLRVHKIVENSWVSSQLAASQGLSSIELLNCV
jgi:hypothetical protein